MRKTKYISLADLEKNYRQIFEEVIKYKTEYIVMEDNQPKFKITPINGTQEEKVFVEELPEEDTVKKFVEE